MLALIFIVGISVVLTAGFIYLENQLKKNNENNL